MSDKKSEISGEPQSRLTVAEIHDRIEESLNRIEIAKASGQMATVEAYQGRIESLRRILAKREARACA